METQDRARQVITFYSFKGGTGRTMALANVACLLARQNRGRVLMIDWDLEAPGLHVFFNSKLQEQVKDTGGLIDLFVELDHASRLKPGTTDPANALLDQIEWERFIVSTEVPRLDLMKAGRFGPDYPERVATFQWEELFHRIPTLMRCFVERLAASYRYVLVDSRTGNSDTGGICTMLLPEKLVAVFTPSAQSLTGLLGIIGRAVGYRRQSEDLRPLVVFPLPSRIDMSEPDLRKSWLSGDTNREGYRDKFSALFKHVYNLSQCDLEDYFKEVQIQYVPRYAYGEEVAALIEPAGDRLSLTRAYETFTDRLKGEVPWEEPALVSIEELHTKLKEIAVNPSENEEERRLAKLLLSQLPADLEQAAQLIEGRADFAIDHLTVAYQFWSIGELARAIEIAEQGMSLAEASNTKDRDELIRRFKNSLAYYYAERGDPESEDLARKYADEALAEAPDQMEFLDTLGFVKVVYGNTPDEIYEAIRLFDRAREKGLPFRVYGEHIARATEKLKTIST